MCDLIDNTFRLDQREVRKAHRLADPVDLNTAESKLPPNNAAAAIANSIFPGAPHTGIFMTGILSIVSPTRRCFNARLFNKPPAGSPIQPAGITMSIIGAITMLLIWDKVVGF